MKDLVLEDVVDALWAHNNLKTVAGLMKCEPTDITVFLESKGVRREGRETWAGACLRKFQTWWDEGTVLRAIAYNVNKYVIIELANEKIYNDAVDALPRLYGQALSCAARDIILEGGVLKDTFVYPPRWKAINLGAKVAVYLQKGNTMTELAEVISEKPTRPKLGRYLQHCGYNTQGEHVGIPDWMPEPAYGEEPEKLETLPEVL